MVHQFKTKTPFEQRERFRLPRIGLITSLQNKSDRFALAESGSKLPGYAALLGGYLFV